MAAAKKSFKTDNPALAFITAAPSREADSTQHTDSTHIPHPAKAETKSRRLNLLVQPSTMEAISKIAYLQHTSANDLINTVLKQYVSENTDAIQKYDTIFPKED